MTIKRQLLNISQKSIDVRSGSGALEELPRIVSGAVGMPKRALLVSTDDAYTAYGDAVDLICVTSREGIMLSNHEDRLRSIVARQHRFDPDDKQALFILYTEELFAVMDNMLRGVNFLILLIGIGTILAGAIGVSNIMMVTVNERTTEIGIRRAIGATPRDILSQIIMESISLTSVAGLSGIVFSVLVLAGLDFAMPDAGFQVTIWNALLVAAMLTVLGVLAGLAPSSRAMQIRPVDAMRDE